MLLVLWSCGLVGMIVVVRRREEPGSLAGWIVGSLDRWRVGGLAGRREEGKKGSRFKYIELDNLGSV